MNILTIRSDKPEAEIGLFEGHEKKQYVTWEAHRHLAETLHQKLRELLATQSLEWKDIDAIVCYEGPGSFTGLRIGLSVANALASSLKIPIIATTGESWATQGITNIVDGKGAKSVVPEYGQPVHITVPRK